MSHVSHKNSTDETCWAPVNVGVGVCSCVHVHVRMRVRVCVCVCVFVCVYVPQIAHVTHINQYVMSCVWTSESCLTHKQYRWNMLGPTFGQTRSLRAAQLRVRSCHSTHMWMNHIMRRISLITHIHTIGKGKNGSYHTCKWVKSHMWLA